MEKKKEFDKSKLLIFTTFIGVILIILIATINEINYESTQEEYNYVVNNFIKASKKCIRINKCKEGNISLSTLYENDLIDEYINPITNKEFNLQSFIAYPDYKFIVVEEKITKLIE